MIWVSIFGTSDYMTSMLSKLVASHPHAQIASIVEDEVPYSYVSTDADYSIFDTIEKSDLIITALPCEKHSDAFQEAVKQGRKVIDISSFTGGTVSRRSSCTSESLEAIEPESVYGLPELNSSDIAKAAIVKNPDSYTTGAVLGLAPLALNSSIVSNSVIIDSKTGISAIGKADAIGSSFIEASENVKAYKLVSQNYAEEMEEQLSKLMGKKMAITFNPCLVPLKRGILTTIYAEADDNISTKTLIKHFKEYYAGTSFVRVLDEGQLPETRNVACTNYCDISAAANEKTHKITITVALDNMMKGTAGQVVQNMNLMYGFPEKSGLEFATLLS